MLTHRVSTKFKNLKTFHLPSDHHHGTLDECGQFYPKSVKQNSNSVMYFELKVR